jgi:hypothetical protein
MKNELIQNVSIFGNLEMKRLFRKVFLLHLKTLNMYSFLIFYCGTDILNPDGYATV